jgi:hypothetical protein
MKRFFSITAALLVLLVVSISQAAAPTYAAVDGVYRWARDTTISSSTAFDTLIGASDSSTIVTYWKPDQEWEYVLVRDAITGNGSDSVKFAIRVIAYDENSNLIYFVDVDSAAALAGEAYALSIAGANFGMKFTIKAKAYTDNGGEVILNRISIWKRKAITNTGRFF